MFYNDFAFVTVIGHSYDYESYGAAHMISDKISSIFAHYSLVYLGVCVCIYQQHGSRRLSQCFQTDLCDNFTMWLRSSAIVVAADCKTCCAYVYMNVNSLLLHIPCTWNLTKYGMIQFSFVWMCLILVFYLCKMFCFTFSNAYFEYAYECCILLLLFSFFEFQSIWLWINMGKTVDAEQKG